MDESDTSYMMYKMQNPMDKSGFTPSSIAKSSKSNLRIRAEDWTMEFPKVKIDFDSKSASDSSN